jgi:polyisoprenoid-binding protein YceI
MTARARRGNVAPMTTAATETRLPAGTWFSDPVHSTVGFAVKHMAVHTFRGRFESFDATLEVGADGSARLAGTVRADSLIVKDPDLQAHLASEEFFDIERHPELRFEATSIVRNDERLEIEGDLTIKGRTRRVSATGSFEGPHEDAGGDTKVGVVLETVVDRRQFGLEWNAPLPKGGWALSNEVKLTAEIAFILR